MYVGGDGVSFLQVGCSEPVDRQHDEGRTDEAEQKDAKTKFTKALKLFSESNRRTPKSLILLVNCKLQHVLY